MSGIIKAAYFQTCECRVCLALRKFLGRGVSGFIHLTDGEEMPVWGKRHAKDTARNLCKKGKILEIERDVIIDQAEQSDLVEEIPSDLLEVVKRGEKDPVFRHQDTEIALEHLQDLIDTIRLQGEPPPREEATIH